MNQKTIFCVAPYDGSDTTMAALRVADCLLTRGHRVQCVASGSGRREWRPYWDRRCGGGFASVFKTMRHEVSDSKDTACLWFDYDPKFLAYIRTEWPAMTHGCLVSDHMLNVGALDRIAVFNAFIRAPGMVDRYRNCANAIDCPWDSGLVMQGRTVPSKTPSIYFHADTRSIDECGWMILEAVCALLLGDVKVTIAEDKSWDKRLRRKWNHLEKTYPGKLIRLRRPTWAKLLETLPGHWASVWLNSKPAFGMPLLVAGACGVPTIAPNTGVVANMGSWCLPASGDSSHGWRFAAADLHVCLRAVVSGGLHLEMREELRARPMDDRQRFEATWDVILSRLFKDG